MLCCDTEDLPAVKAGKFVMKHIDDDAVALGVKVMNKIKSAEEAEITIRAKHGFVTSIGLKVVEFFTKSRTVD